MNEWIGLIDQPTAAVQSPDCEADAGDRGHRSGVAGMDCGRAVAGGVVKPGFCLTMGEGGGPA